MIKRFVYKVFTFAVIICIILFALMHEQTCVKHLKKIPGVYYIAKGDHSLKKGDLLQAIDYYEKGLTLFPTHTKAWCNLGNILVLYENYPDAIEKYEKGLKNTDKYFDCRINLGIVYAEKMIDYDEAIEQYQKVVKSKIPAFTIPYFTRDKKTAKENQGLAYYNMGLAYRGKSLLAFDDKELATQYLEKSVEMYSKALKILGKNYDAQYNYALANHLLGNTHKTKKAYCKAISYSLLNYEAHYNLAILLKNEKDYRAALDEFEKASLILDYKGDANISRYVFDVMNELTQKISAQEGGNEYLIERFDKNINGMRDAQEVTYIKGKVVVPNEFNKAILRNLQTCVIDDKYNRK